MQGPTVGAYVTYLDNAFYADATFKADFLDIKISVVLVDVHRYPMIESSFGNGTVPLIVGTRSERDGAAGKGRPFLENVVKIHRPPTGDEVGFIRHTFSNERRGKLARRTTEISQFEFKEIKKITVQTAIRNALD